MLGKQSTSLAKAKFWLNKIDDDNKNKKTLIGMIEKAEKVFNNNVARTRAKAKTMDFKVPDNAVYITYNSKFGRGLVASRDFKFGEFVCIEKFYATSCNSEKLYAYCSHCLAICWTAIPCRNCSYYMFCGEKCRDEAWEKYHDIECCINIASDSYSDYFTQMGVRALIQGIKEAGSIQNLRDMTNEVDKCTGRFVHYSI